MLRVLLRRSVLFLALALVAPLAICVAAAAPAHADADQRAGSYVSVPSFRLVDTRNGITGNPAGTLAPGQTRTYTAAGIGGLPSSGVSAIVATIVPVNPAAAGTLVAWAAGTSRPYPLSNVQFVKGQQVANLTVVGLSSSGNFSLISSSKSPLDVVVDVSGYYASGSDGTASTFVPVTPARFLDTRTGTGVQEGALSGHEWIPVQVGGRGGVPVGAAAVVAVLSAVTPEKTGTAIVWKHGESISPSANLQFEAGLGESNLVVAPLSSDGLLNLSNQSSGKVHMVIDVVGYYRSGVPATAGALGVLGPTRLVDTRSGLGTAQVRMAPQASIDVTLAGRGGVPMTGVSAVIGTLSAVAPTKVGQARVFAEGGRDPGTVQMQYGAGHSVSGLVVVPLSSGGKATLRNVSSGSVDFVLDVSGYVLAADIPTPRLSTSHYVRNIDGGTGDATTMRAEGEADAANGSSLVVLHIGAQLNNKTGVLLSSTDTQLTYAELVTALQGYLDGFGARSGARIVIATNNEAADWVDYTDTARGTDWADKVVDQLSPGAGVTVLGGNDIEAGFRYASTYEQARVWEVSYLGAAATKQLVFTGDANDCPKTPGATTSCSWTLAQQCILAGGTDPTQILALPQVYYAFQGVQWANVAAAGCSTDKTKIHFIGALTEYAADPEQLAPSQGYAALWNGLAAIGVTPDPAVTDLSSDY